MSPIVLAVMRRYWKVAPARPIPRLTAELLSLKRPLYLRCYTGSFASKGSAAVSVSISSSG